MSDATYKITLRPDPHSVIFPWDALVTRLADGLYMHTAYGLTEEEATTAAREWIAAETSAVGHGKTLLVDDDGQDADDDVVTELA